MSRTALRRFWAGSIRPSSSTIAPSLGSSGAVAGIFGAWLVLALRRSRRESFGWRSRVRSLGVAILVLPGVLGLVGESGSGMVLGPLTVRVADSHRLFAGGDEAATRS